MFALGGLFSFLFLTVAFDHAISYPRLRTIKVFESLGRGHYFLVNLPCHGINIDYLSHLKFWDYIGPLTLIATTRDSCCHTPDWWQLTCCGDAIRYRDRKTARENRNIQFMLGQRLCAMLHHVTNLPGTIVLGRFGKRSADWSRPIFNRCPSNTRQRRMKKITLTVVAFSFLSRNRPSLPSLPHSSWTHKGLSFCPSFLSSSRSK